MRLKLPSAPRATALTLSEPGTGTGTQAASQENMQSSHLKNKIPHFLVHVE